MIFWFLDIASNYDSFRFYNIFSICNIRVWFLRQLSKSGLKSLLGNQLMLPFDCQWLPDCQNMSLMVFCSILYCYQHNITNILRTNFLNGVLLKIQTSFADFWRLSLNSIKYRINLFNLLSLFEHLYKLFEFCRFSGTLSRICDASHEAIGNFGLFYVLRIVW